MTKKEIRYYSIYSKFNTQVLMNILRDYETVLKDLLTNVAYNVAQIQNINHRMGVVQDIIKSRKGH